MSAQPNHEEARREASVINRIVAFALGQPLLIVLLSVALAAAGVWAYEALPMDAYPDLSPPYVEIISQWPGHSAEEVERLITVPVERAMNAIPGLTIPIWFVPNVTTAEMRTRTGNAEFQYEIACAQLCGLGHAKMRGFVTVQTAEEFQKWLDEKIKEQSAPDPFR